MSAARRIQFQTSIERCPLLLEKMIYILHWQMRSWGNSAGRQRELSNMLDEWGRFMSLCLFCVAFCIMTWNRYIAAENFLPCGSGQLISAGSVATCSCRRSIYLSEAEPFLEQYPKRCVENQALIGSAGSFVRLEDVLAIVDGGRDEEGDLERELDVVPASPSVSGRDSVTKTDGLMVFSPGISGCAKSAICKELLSAGGFGDDRTLHTLMGDIIKGM
ncbi:hypothetical protein MLD38_003527 [Melastoma candidum]|uniref:Uncharacterized protein n=1 Tax=Melastoma candidum TaxID=119954 RepID=A0ACB9S2V8_9MYRT|nr:hypothetical protein MLD38_003527 [Melastoma candidum]